MTNGRRSKQMRAQNLPHRGSAAPDALEAKRRRTRLVAGVVIVAASVGGVGTWVAVAAGGTAPVTAGLQPVFDVGPIQGLGHLTAPPVQGTPGPEVVPIPDAPVIAGTTSAAQGQSIDGVSCDTSEQVLYHIHIHLTLFIGGTQRDIPPGIGVPNPQVENTPQGPFVDSGSCFYWLHTHAADGIIHVESPSKRLYTLGQFFDIWGETLSPTQVGPDNGPVVAFYNGKRYLANPREIPLTPHANVQLDVGAPLIGPVTVSSWGQL
ncbi:MAG TPA: hypothetical protein VKR22_01905 [Acidimicrobiales bacterium]|nr:hypothetical protein [Acidimicrobiales bacterium]